MTTTTKNQWRPNEKQAKFLETLKGQTEPKTLNELKEIAQVEFTTGCINPLATKGLVKTEDKTFECEIVLTGTRKVVGHTKKTVKVYSLAE